MANELDFILNNDTNDTTESTDESMLRVVSTDSTDKDSVADEKIVVDSFDKVFAELKPEQVYENQLTRDFTWTTDPEVKEYQKQYLDKIILKVHTNNPFNYYLRIKII